jgi:hypothetical protein
MSGKDCDKMRDGGRMHCGHIEEGKPCCQCGYVRGQPVEYLEPPPPTAGKE